MACSQMSPAGTTDDDVSEDDRFQRGKDEVIDALRQSPILGQSLESLQQILEQQASLFSQNQTLQDAQTQIINQQTNLAEGLASLSTEVNLTKRHFQAALTDSRNEDDVPGSRKASAFSHFDAPREAEDVVGANPDRSVLSEKLAIIDGVRHSWDEMNGAIVVTGMEKLLRPTFTFLPCL